MVGCSIIQRVGEHSKFRLTGTFLGLQQLGCQLVWVGMPGMRWENVVPLIHSLINYRGIPFAVIIYCGGNDIGLLPCGELLFHIKFTIAILSTMLPGTSLVWSSILPRMKWRYSENIRNMEITRKRVNRGVRSYLLKIGGYVIRHRISMTNTPLCLKRTVCICRLLPMTFFLIKYKVLSKHF